MNKDVLQAKRDRLARVHLERISVEKRIGEVKSALRGSPHNGSVGHLQRELSVRLKPLATACYIILAEMRGKSHTSGKIEATKLSRTEDFVYKLV